MIVEYKRIDLFGKMLFEKAIIRPPFSKPNPMPNEACFLHIREGAYHSIGEDDFLPVRKGQSVLMRCGNYLSQMIPDQDTGLYQAVAVHFHPEVLRQIYANGLPAFMEEKRKSTTLAMALVQATVPVDKYIDDILFYFDYPRLANEEILALKTREIILLLMQTPEAPRIRKILENLFVPRTVDFTTIIESHLYSPIGLTEYAQLTNMSLSSFKRKFRTIYQATPHHYIQQKRLKKAGELLLFSDHPVSEIAAVCGFKTTSHFSTRFRAHSGQTPSEYRMNRSEK